MTSYTIPSKALPLKIILVWLPVIILIATFLSPSPIIQTAAAEEKSVTIGWIGSLTGLFSKFMTWEATQIAVEEINAAGGINGRKIKLIAEDSHCDPKAALTAARKLINMDKVKFILGGHCSNETLAVAPVAEKNDVILVATISSNPEISHAGKNIFRLSPVSTRGASSLARHALTVTEISSAAILYAESAYSTPLAESFEKSFAENGGKIVLKESFGPAETDFKSLAARIKAAAPDSVYIAAQAPDISKLVLRDLKNTGFQGYILGNTALGSAVNKQPSLAGNFKKILYSDPAWDSKTPAAQKLLAEFKTRFRLDSLPAGFWTAESYDAVKVLASVLRACGTTPASTRKCLSGLKDFSGASGQITIDANGDAKRFYQIKSFD